MQRRSVRTHWYLAVATALALLIILVGCRGAGSETTTTTRPDAAKAPASAKGQAETKEAAAPATQPDTQPAGSPAAQPAVGSPAVPPGQTSAGARESLLSDLARNKTGVTDTEIKLGGHTSLSGPIAGYSVIPRSTAAWFKKINEEKGGVHGRKITFLFEDDVYKPPNALQVSKKLVEQDQIFAMFQGLGTPTHSAVIDYLLQNKIPDMFQATGASKWGFPPKNAPPEWSTLVFAFQPNYVNEGTILARYAVDTYKPKTYAMFFQNDDFGKDGADSFAALMDKEGVRRVGSETYESTDTTFDAQVIKLRQANPDVVLLFSTPKHTSKFLKKAEELGWRPQFLMSAVLADPEIFKLTSNEIMEGINTLIWLPLFDEMSNPEVVKHHEFLKQYAGDMQPQNFTIFGQCMAQLMVEVLEKAGKDLNRASLITGAEQIKGPPAGGWICPNNISMGPDDHRAFEVMRIAVGKNGRFEPMSDYIDAKPVLALPR